MVDILRECGKDERQIVANYLGNRALGVPVLLPPIMGFRIAGSRCVMDVPSLRARNLQSGILMVLAI